MRGTGGWTPTTARARVGVFCVAVLVLVIQLIKMLVAAALPVVSPGEPAKAIYWWVVQLIIAIVAAVIAYAVQPKVENAVARGQDMPTVDDGQSVDEFHGDCWQEKEFIQGQVIVAKEPIKSGGKK